MSFIEEMVPLTMKYMRQEGILASLTLAQAILESDSGKSELAVKANNFFGIKANSTWKGAVYNKMTKEYLNGKWVEVMAAFCHFDSIEHCLEYRSTVFLKNPRYKPLWGITDYKKAAQVIWECGYATAPDYPQRLINLIEQYELYKNDKEEAKTVKMFIDPGHGGTDPGAVGNGLQEKNVTLDIAIKIRTILENEYENVEVRMSRTSDMTVSLAQRTSDANAWGADYFLSIHINAGGGTGFESYRFTNAPTQTARYQSIIHPEIVLESIIRDRGMKVANFHVLRETRMSALLTENLFIDTKADADLLKKNEVRNAIAQGHVAGLVKAFGLRKNGQATPSPSLQPSSKPAKVNHISLFQEWLNKTYKSGLVVDGMYGSKTRAAAIKALQTEHNRQYNARLVIDGIYGPKTKAAIRTIRKGTRGILVYILQGLLYCQGHDPKGFDGVFGDNTEAAVLALQKATKITQDGLPGKNTFDKLVA